LAAAEPYLPASVTRLEPGRRFLFSGHCSHELVDSLASRLGKADETGLIIGVGGGSALDTAKALAVKLELPFAAIPTIASTCAAATPLSVWYTPEGKALGFEVFNKAADAVLVEPRVILDSPAEYLKAGLADTLAKWYEAEILAGREAALRLGLNVAAALKETLLEKGKAAKTARETGALSPEFVEVVDAIILGGALVGGLGEKYTRVAAAHALHNGMSVLSETHHIPHGIKVAYGLLVQAALMEDGSLKELIPKFRELDLPRGLEDLGIDSGDEEKLRRFIEASLIPSESIHYLPLPVSADRLLRAIKTVEELRRV
ncbi:MAG: iron-containing alcohol dehydrogenase family protein, partial [Treponema sp.]|nr:iron-containing alcohol dehydrogenase family protein [Treponema sp.]